MKTSELTGAALDWAVAKAEGWLEPKFGEQKPRVVVDTEFWVDRPAVCWNPRPQVYYDPEYHPSTDWAQGGPIIERESITLNYDNLDGTGPCKAYYLSTLFEEEEGWHQYGPTPLIAAMRCYVASKLGDEVEIPEELK